MKKLAFHIGRERIPFFLGTNALRQIAEGILSLSPDVIFIICDGKVMEIFGQELLAGFEGAWNVHTVIAPEGEPCKSLSCLEEVASRILQYGGTRRSIIVALGGGAVCNLAGLCAGLLFRGIRFVQVPTTLLAMHDVVTSQKQAVNCRGIKNILGVYTSPEAIYCDTKFLSTLPQRQVLAGLAELAKNALLFSGASEQALLSFQNYNFHSKANGWVELIMAGVACKCTLIEKDPFEKKEGLVFEYGHTVGHALESASGGVLNHGEAIIWGMRVAAVVAQELKLMHLEAAEEHESILASLRTIPSPPNSLTTTRILECIRNDNKRGLGLDVRGAVSMVLLREKGSVVWDDRGYPLTPVPIDLIEHALCKIFR